MAFLSTTALLDYDNTDRRHPAMYGEVASSGPADLNFPYLDQLQLSAAMSQFVQVEQWYTSLRDQLNLLRGLRKGWDSYSAPTPNELAIEAANQALQTLRTLNATPTAILPSADGGVGICFSSRDRYAHFEFLNIGEVWVLTYGTIGSAETWQVSRGPDSLTGAWTRISAYLQP
jgi:hypothetical protein